MSNMQTVTLTLAFDLDALNKHLGNTPNVNAQDAIREALEGLGHYQDSCGNYCVDDISLSIEFGD